jgi:Fic family protein
MIYRTPSLTVGLRAKLSELDTLRAALAGQSGLPSPWLGSLRRVLSATSVASSASIEGYVVDDEEALAIVSGRARASAENDDQLAVECYSRAMEHVGVMALDAGFRWSPRAVLDLHFDACSFQRDKDPGRWRSTPIGVTRPDGRPLYEAPAAELVPELMREVVAWLENGDHDAHAVLRAAMAHLHVVSVHPFRDGNGRVARIVQSLVLAREGLLTPEFASIEEYLGANTSSYYAVLEHVQGGRYQPERDASEWVEFCIDAHLVQARRRLDQLREAAARWTLLEELVEANRWPDRFVIALEQSLIGGTDRSTYAQEANISLPTASNDFRRLVDTGLLERHGSGRATRYSASAELRARVNAVRPSA